MYRVVSKQSNHLVQPVAARWRAGRGGAAGRRAGSGGCAGRGRTAGGRRAGRGRSSGSGERSAAARLEQPGLGKQEGEQVRTEGRRLVRTTTTTPTGVALISGEPVAQTGVRCGRRRWRRRQTTGMSGHGDGPQACIISGRQREAMRISEVGPESPCTAGWARGRHGRARTPPPMCRAALR